MDIIDLSCIFVTTKGNKQGNINQRAMEKAIEITSRNGMRYQFVEWTLFRTLVDAYCWFNNRWNRLGRSFNSFAEAEAWVAELDARHESVDSTPQSAAQMPEGAYYSITGYYGD